MMKNNECAIRLHNLRKERKLTGEEVGKAIGVSREIINHWEHGTRQIKAAHVAALAKFYDVTADYILGLDKNKTSSIEVKEICNYTGLPVDIVETLHKNDYDAKFIRSVLCRLAP